MNNIYDFDLELEILGFIYYQQKKYYRYEEYIKECYFYDNRLRKVYLFFKEILDKNETLTDGTIKKFLDSLSLKNDEKDLLSVIKEKGYGIVDLRYRLDKLKNFYYKRKLKDLSDFIKDKINTENSEELSKDISSQLEAIEDDIDLYQFEVKKIDDILNNRINEIEYNINNKTLSNYLKTGLLGFDKRFTGIPRGQLTLLASRPSLGKTTTALQIALNVSKNYNVLFFSLEMGLKENADKILANVNLLNSIKFRDSILNNNELEKVKNDLKNIKNNLYIVEKTNIDCDYIDKTIKRFEKIYGKVDLVICDHLQIMKDKRKSFSRLEELGNITLDCKEIAKKNDCGFLLLSQLTRSVDIRDDKRPELSDLRESGRIEENADLICFLYREDYYFERKNNYNIDLLNNIKGVLEMWVKKYRNGDCGCCYQKFIKEYSIVSDLSYNEEEIYNNIVNKIKNKKEK